jgi:hypothetical protein
MPDASVASRTLVAIRPGSPARYDEDGLIGISWIPGIAEGAGENHVA